MPDKCRLTEEDREHARQLARAAGPLSEKQIAALMRAFGPALRRIAEERTGRAEPAVLTNNACRATLRS